MKQAEFVHLDWLSPKQSQTTSAALLIVMDRIPKTASIPVSYKQLATNSYVLVTSLRSNLSPKHTKATDKIIL